MQFSSRFAAALMVSLGAGAASAQSVPPPTPPPPPAPPPAAPAADAQPTAPPPTAPAPAAPAPAAAPASAADAPVAAPPEIGAEDPVVLHARGLARIYAGDPLQGLSLLRRANRLAPDDELIAFDLARAARAHGGIPEDQRALLAVQPTTASTGLLQAYILLDLGDTDGATARVEATVAENPGDEEAQALLHILRPQTPSTTSGGLQVERKVKGGEPSRFAGRVRLSAVVDTNVTVVPDAASGQQGYRAKVDAAALFNLLRGDLSADLGAAVLYAPHLNDRRGGAAPLGELDMLAAVGLVTVEHRTSVLVWDFDATASEVFLDGVAEHFMQDFGGQMSAALLWGSLQTGLYGRASYRDFLALNDDGTPTDRDGFHVGGGVVLRWKGAAGLSAEGRVGAQSELTDGDNMTERGPEARLMLRWRRARFGARLGVAYAMRDYHELQEGERTDQRFTPQLALRYGLTDWVGVHAGYALTRNLSKKSYDYTRHVASLGVEATW